MKVFLSILWMLALVLSEPVAATNLSEDAAPLQNQSASVFDYPPPRLASARRSATGEFEFTITGPPGVYTVASSTDFRDWDHVGATTNLDGTAPFNDAATNVVSPRFYKAQWHGTLTNMVFVPATIFTMGSPAGEQDRQTNESPQTIVTLSRGIWIGKYEVTQGEYLSVMSTNPSEFPGDLSRPVSSVSWPDATNYCWKLTQRELAAGRIPGSSQYRLPTEAEWECASRAGTSTRFSYGDDPGYTNLSNYAWHSFEGGLTVHPVGQKLSNPWGLYDMTGNVLEWCQDWLGPLPGGEVVDPKGPPSNSIGWKVIRGGAFDYGASTCRSANRLFFGNHPALIDWDLGFRVVLATEP